MLKAKLITALIALAMVGGLTYYNAKLSPQRLAEERYQEAMKLQAEQEEAKKAEAQEMQAAQQEKMMAMQREMAAAAEENAKADADVVLAKAGTTTTAAPEAVAPPAPPAATITRIDVPVQTKWPAEMPAVFKLKFECTAGDFIMEVHEDWSPAAAGRIYDLARSGYFKDVKFFRVVKGFMAQFGLAADPAVGKKWTGKNLADEPMKQSNLRGYVSFARAGRNTRSTQMFINYKDNTFLDRDSGFGFPPFALVIEGMDTVDRLNGKYGDQPSSKQGQIRSQGNAFLDKYFPGLDSIKDVYLVKE
jgi:cyclophilin family peptidyl-prolyl cis-trans isomerase